MLRSCSSQNTTNNWALHRVCFFFTLNAWLKIKLTLCSQMKSRSCIVSKKFKILSQHRNYSSLKKLVKFFSLKFVLPYKGKKLSENLSGNKLVEKNNLFRKTFTEKSSNVICWRRKYSLTKIFSDYFLPFVLNSTAIAWILSHWCLAE